MPSLERRSSIEGQPCIFLKNEDALKQNQVLINYFEKIIDSTIPESFEEGKDYVSKQYWKDRLSNVFHEMLGDYEKKEYDQVWREMVKTEHKQVIEFIERFGNNEQKK